MRKLEKRLDPSIKLARVLVARAASLTLPFEARCKSRLAAQLDNGEDVALLMPRGTVLAHDDILVADDGGLVRVVAASEPLMRVTATSPAQLIRAAYHLGNRHTPVQLADGFLQLENDGVLQQMLEGIGMTVSAVEAPFQPEAGAYGGGHRHGHDATFAEDYALAQKVYAEHDHGHAHKHDHGHAHDHDHKHDHGHAHDHGQAHGHDHAPVKKPAARRAIPIAAAHVHGPGCGHDH